PSGSCHTFGKRRLLPLYIPNRNWDIDWPFARHLLQLVANKVVSGAVQGEARLAEPQLGHVKQQRDDVAVELMNFLSVRFSVSVADGRSQDPFVDQWLRFVDERT